MEKHLDQLLTEMQRLNEQMQHDQSDIDRLKAETAVYKAAADRSKQEHLQWREDMEKLRQEGTILDSQIRAALDRLKEMMK